ncbi:pseudouridine synthase [Paenibacillus sp. J2TS4]|uniref:pseudouridine synthase n=1 Tax=Paenibacillus sp. J2TS4 TaxID=2807194 RepID=UPI001B008333|nr:pseudouridine synthase [Paenibacillus sp. J2TS4]GIP33920.1 pseudouridine synthase [Paenibacillus sp. J2TS4]
MRSTQRLDKLLAHAGWGTRSEIKKLVKRGAVTVNGRKVKDSGLQVDPYEDHIQVGSEPVDYKEFIYIMMNKPPGVISATEDVREKTVLDLLGPEASHFRVFPVGRLDKDTEGLLLLTNDGKLAHNLLSPKKEVPKTYFAEVEGIVTDEDRFAFSKGVSLDDGYVTLPAELVILNVDAAADKPLSKIELTIREGKFHQVKRMFQAVGKRVVYLQRISMGSLQLDSHLSPGGYRELTEKELDNLKHSSTE